MRRYAVPQGGFSNSIMDIRTDCQHFPLDRPCRFHKEKGTHCAECRRYVPVRGTAGRPLRVLIVKIGAMGDVLRTTFLLPGLAQRYSRPAITWIVAPVSTGVLEGNPYISRIWPMDREIFSRLLAEEFDVVVNLDLSPESLALATLAAARRRIGFWLDAKRRVQCSNSFARRWLAMSAFDDLKRANTQTYQRWMAKIAGLPRSDYEIQVPLRKDAVARAQAFAARQGLTGRVPVIGINPGAGGRWRLKKWTDEGYLDIIGRCKSIGAKVVLFGGPEEKELLDSLVKRSRGAAVSAGADNALPDFFGRLSLCDVLITGDTMAMHAALGLKKKVVAIFGPTSAAEIELYGRGLKVVSPKECACCYRPSCAEKTTCMDMIEPDLVWAAVASTLKA